MKRLTSILLGLAVVFPLYSCSVKKTVSREGLVTDAASGAEQSPKKDFDFSNAPGARVRGYTTTDGAYHAFDGRAWIDGDAMVFDRPARKGGMEADQQAVRQRVALSDLASVEGVKTHTARSVALGVGVTLGMMAAVGASIGSNIGFAGWD